MAASRERELIESYRKAILAALADVECALASGSRTADQESLQAASRGTGATMRCGSRKSAIAKASTIC